MSECKAVLENGSDSVVFGDPCLKGKNDTYLLEHSVAQLPSTNKSPLGESKITSVGKYFCENVLSHFCVVLTGNQCRQSNRGVIITYEHTC